MMMKTACRAAMLVAVVTTIGCKQTSTHNTSTGSDGGTGNGQVDGSLVTDLGQATDMESAADLSVAADLGTTADLGIAADLGTEIDLGTSSDDLGVAIDMSVSDDLGVASDLGAAMDMSVATDLGVATDMEVDAGPTDPTIIENMIADAICAHYCPPLVTTTDTPMTVIQLPLDIAHAIDTSAETCRAFVLLKVLGPYIANVIAGTKTFDPTAALDCLAQLESTSTPTCIDLAHNVLPGACAQTFVGAVAIGGTGCNDNSDCADNGQCGLMCGAPSRCLARDSSTLHTNPGDICNTDADICVSAVYGPMNCVFSDIDNMGHCEAMVPTPNAPAGVMAQCGAIATSTAHITNYVYCDPSEYCSTDFICLPRDAGGAQCDYYGQSCAYGYYCPQFPVGLDITTCQPLPFLSEGATCSPTLFNMHRGTLADVCDPTLNLVCALYVPPTSGEMMPLCMPASTDVTGGALGDYCARDYAAPYGVAPCGAGLMCNTMEQCEAAHTTGELCVIDRDCASGYGCSAGTCQPCVIGVGGGVP